MKNITTFIAEKTNGKSFHSHKYCHDVISIPKIEYEDNDDNRSSFSILHSGETIKYDNTINLAPKAKELIDNNIQPLFKYFLDGSRHTYKIDDISYNNEVFPILAGQIGVGCLERNNKSVKPLKLKRSNILVLPDRAKNNDWDGEYAFQHLNGGINKLMKMGIKIDKILPYKTSNNKLEDIENSGIAKIQSEMINEEKEMVKDLVSQRFLNQDQYLLKDGSLEYSVDEMQSEKEINIFRNNYHYVVGASKSFNPAICKDKKGRINTHQISTLPLYHRTPVLMFESERIRHFKFAIWYVRIRDSKYTTNILDGVLKLEQILVTDGQLENGMDSEIVDLISANIINERNPVCYASDSRWANHLYPIYLTELFVKSKYISNTMFINLF